MRLGALWCRPRGPRLRRHLRSRITDTTDAGVVATFQSGATVQNFDSISGRTPLTITSYTSGTPVPSSAFVFNQVAGVQFSVGGMVGVNEPALYSLSGGIASDAKWPPTVLGPVDLRHAPRSNRLRRVSPSWPAAPHFSRTGRRHVTAAATADSSLRQTFQCGRSRSHWKGEARLLRYNGVDMNNRSHGSGSNPLTPTSSITATALRAALVIASLISERVG